jgi:hypothetical protein
MKRPGRPQQMQRRNGGRRLFAGGRTVGGPNRLLATVESRTRVDVRADLASHAGMLPGAKAETEA